MARIVVVGAGVGGLAAAARLAAAKHDVTVVEAADLVGGKLGRAEHATDTGTFRFDTGPSLLALPQVFEELFAETGDPIDSVLTLRRVDPITRYRFADGTVLDAGADRATQAERHDAAFGPGAGAAWTALLRRGERIWAATEHTVLRAALTPASAARRLGRIGDLAAVAPGRTLRQLGRHLLPDPRQRAMLDRYATFTGSDPRRAPAALAVIPFLEQAFGSWYIDGGLYGLATALARRVVDHGGIVRTGCPVQRIDCTGGQVQSAVLSDGERLRADVVVANADAHSLYSTLVSPPPKKAPAADSSSGFALLLGLRGRTRDRSHHTVLFGPGGYDDEFDALFARPGQPVDDPAIYVCAPDDPAGSPPGYEAWFVLVNAPRHGRDGAPGTLDWDAPALASSYADKIVARLGERGLPVADRIALREVRTPADLERRTLAPGGAIYGAALRGIGTTLRRPPNRSRVRGLYLVGGSTHPGGGLPMVALSAKIVAGLIGPA